MAERYDCVVVGSGPGGYVAAIRAAQLGMRTAIVEKDKVGGRCLNYACIPAKACCASPTSSLRRSTPTVRGEGRGTSVDFGGVAKHRDKVIETLTGGVGGLFKKNEVEVVDGHGSLNDDANVVVGGSFDGRELEADKVVLATGSISKPLLELSSANGWSTPRRVATSGSCRAAGGDRRWRVRNGDRAAFGRIGTEVVLLEALPQILPLEDEEIARHAAREIEKQNVKSSPTRRRARRGGDVKVTFGGDGKQSSTTCASQPAAGPTSRTRARQGGREDRRPRAGQGRRAMRTSPDDVYAIGDVVPGPR